MGSHLVKRLSRSHDEIFCLSRKSPNPPNSGRIYWINGEITDPLSYQDFLKETDYVYHLAGIVNARRAEEYRQVNVEGTKILLRSCYKAARKLKKFIHMSSIAAMGPTNNARLLDESLPCHPMTEYGKSKLAAEKVAFEYSKKLPLVIIRPSFIYGQGDKRGLSILSSILAHSADTYRSSIKAISLCNVSDITQCCILAAKNNTGSGEVFIVSDGKVYTWDYLRALLCDICTRLAISDIGISPAAGNNPNISNANTHGRYCWGCDISKAKALLGYKPKTMLAKGAFETIRWYLHNDYLTKYGPPFKNQIVNGDNYAAKNY